MSSHKPIIIYMGGLILGINTLYRLFCFFKLFPMVGKGLALKIQVMGAQRVKETIGYHNIEVYFPVNCLIFSHRASRQR